MSAVRKFTLRLDEVEVKKVPRLMEITQENTATGAIKHLIRNFDDLNNRYLAEKDKKNEIAARYYELQKQVETLFSTSDNIKRLLADEKKILSKNEK